MDQSSARSYPQERGGSKLAEWEGGRGGGMLLLLRGDAMQEVGGLSDALTNGQTNDQTTSKEDGVGELSPPLTITNRW